uniref:Metalloendopeptidase n=1 Tax=Pachycerianthus borealis TaxID=2736680 RepID=A0A7G7WYQ5_9CNID|nr:toxin candidate TRINITY_DN32249_c4_g5_i3 [Pachycerianthus borealis]
MRAFILVCLLPVVLSINESPRLFVPNTKPVGQLRPGDIIDGDIVLDERSLYKLKGVTINRNVPTDIRLWPSGVVPYLLDSSVDAVLKQAMLDGIAEYNKYTCLKIIPRTNERDYIRIVKPQSGCNSMVGSIGGEQILNMGPGCQYKGLAIHELGHAIGFYHEHNRPDRDQYITIKWDHVQSSFKDAFYKYSTSEADTHGFAYDINSIMHYENDAFSLGVCRPTMLYNADPTRIVRPVYRREFSPDDIKKINDLYSCPEPSSYPPPVLPGDGDATACNCVDESASCSDWKDWGECWANMFWMSTHCPESCRTCPDPNLPCNDFYPVACEHWADLGECDANPYWMHENCKRSCGKCDGTPVTDAPTRPPVTDAPTHPPVTDAPTRPPVTDAPTNPPVTDAPTDCKDVYPSYCPTYKGYGWCTDGTHLDYMTEVCSKTCGFCGGSNPNCKDIYPDYCPTYQGYGWCTDASRLDYMTEVCSKTCGFC